MRAAGKAGKAAPAAATGAAKASAAKAAAKASASAAKAAAAAAKARGEEDTDMSEEDTDGGTAAAGMDVDGDPEDSFHLTPSEMGDDDDGDVDLLGSLSPTTQDGAAPSKYKSRTAAARGKKPAVNTRAGVGAAGGKDVEELDSEGSKGGFAYFSHGLRQGFPVFLFEGEEKN
jgi:hypothetical protein